MAHRFAFVNSEGELKGITSPGSDDQYVNLQSYGDTTAVIIPTDIDNDELMVTGWYDLEANTWGTRIACPASYFKWVNKAWAFDSTTFFSELRSMRDEKLFESDWTQFNDSPLTDSEKAKWTTYRSALRDLPSTNANVTSMEDVVWPTKP
ncbi:MAG: tail fiber assembly protein [Vibrio toranzoniae]|uniref:tail fiber assembly protein n=1 Tax=Vibrio toranzoniae TaxID=1194427 RepID=UPI003C5A1C92